MPIRRRVGVALPGCLVAALCFFLARDAGAQQEQPPGERATSAPATADEAAGEPTSRGEAEAASTDPEPSSSAADAEATPELAAAEPDADEADEPVEDEPSVEEFLVTARKIEILVPDSTVSVVGFDPQELRAEGISDIRDIAKFTPGLEIKSAFAASNPTIFIRGVGLDDYNANSASAVSIYQDGVYMASPAGQLFQFFDVDRVEVLRGPQPVLFRNAEAGAILVNSAPPTDEFDAYVTGTYGTYDLIQFEGALGGPILSELLSARVSATWEQRDGITENRCSAPLRPNGERSTDRRCDLSERGFDGTLQFQHDMEEWTNNLDNWAGRGQLLFTPSLGETEMEWLANVHGGRNRSRAFQYQHRGVRFATQTSDVPIIGDGEDVSGYSDNDDDPFAGDYNLDGPEDIDLFGANLRGSWLFGENEYELRSLTAYEWHDRYTQENSDASSKYALESDYFDDAWQLSQDLSLSGNWGSLFEWEIGDGEWTLGAYYLQEDLHVRNVFVTAPERTPQHLSQEYTQKTRNYAAYAQTEYRIRPGCSPIPCDFTLLGGIRYNVEYKSFDTDVCEDGGVIGACDLTALKGNDDATWKAPAGSVSLAWDYSENSSLYVKYSRGWKGGHFNGSATTVFDVITGVDPEILDSYEGGLRSYWFDERLMLNATFFYYDYQDLQVFIIDQTPLGYPIPKLVNAADAVVYGAELDLGVEPLPGLNLTYNFAWVESEYLDFTVLFAKKIFPPPACDRGCPRPPPIFIAQEYVYTGNSLIAAPRFAMTGSAEYTLPLPGTLFGQGLGSLIPRFSFSWKDEINFDACGGKGSRCNFPEAFFGERPYWLFNATLTWRSEDERFEIMGWVYNFTDTHYKSQNFDLSEGLGIILDAYAEPRTFGITATISF